jgi:hypothetical protein
MFHVYIYIYMLTDPSHQNGQNSCLSYFLHLRNVNNNKEIIVLLQTGIKATEIVLNIFKVRDVQAKKISQFMTSNSTFMVLPIKTSTFIGKITK